MFLGAGQGLGFLGGLVGEWDKEGISREGEGEGEGGMIYRKKKPRLPLPPSDFQHPVIPSSHHPDTVILISFFPSMFPQTGTTYPNGPPISPCLP